MTGSKKKILVLGGTGAMGIYLVPKLANMGYEVHVTSRKVRKSNNRNIIYIVGDAKNDGFLEGLLADGYDAIVDFMVYNTDEFTARCEKLLSATEHYLFLSSYRVYADAQGKALTESSPRLLDTVKDPEYLATDEYGLTKARQENILLGSGRSNWTILRPAITYATGRFQLATMETAEFVYRALNGKDIIFPREMLDKETTMSWGSDVAKMIALLVLNSKAYGEIFTLSTSEHHKWKEVIEYYKKILGVRVKIVSLKEYQEVTRATWRVKYDRMLNRVIDNTKVLEATGMQQSELMPLYDGLRIELANFSRKPQYEAINHALQKRMDKSVFSRRRELLDKLKKVWRNRQKIPGKIKDRVKKLKIVRLIRGR